MAKYRIRPKGRGGDFTFETDGKVFQAAKIKRLIQAIALHRLENDGDLAPDWDQRLMERIREKYPKEFAVEPLPGYGTTGAKYLSVMAFFRQVKAHGKNGRTFVDRDEAVRRRDICLSCPKRTNLVACGKCRAEVAQLFFKVPEEFDFGTKGRAYCGACGCSLVHKTWLLPVVLADDPREINYPEHCWVRSAGSTDSEAPHTQA